MIGTGDNQIPNGAGSYIPVDFAKIRVGVKSVSDAILKLGDYRNLNPLLGDKEQVLRAIQYGDLEKMRDISNYFYKVSGIYQRLCRYMAYMYRYDWLVTPYYDSKLIKADKLLNDFNKVLTYLDNF